MATLKGFTQDAVEKKRYTIDYGCWLEDSESVANYAIGISPATSPPLAGTGSFVDGTFKKVTTFLAGGVPGTTYAVEFVMTTNQGQIKSDTIALRVT